MMDKRNPKNAADPNAPRLMKPIVRYVRLGGSFNEPSRTAATIANTNIDIVKTASKIKS